MDLLLRGEEEREGKKERGLREGREMIGKEIKGGNVRFSPEPTWQNPANHTCFVLSWLKQCERQTITDEMITASSDSILHFNSTLQSGRCLGYLCPHNPCGVVWAMFQHSF